MVDIITILGLIIGVILFITSRKKQNLKVLHIFSVFVIILSLTIAAPDFIKGFKDGFNVGFNSLSQ